LTYTEEVVVAGRLSPKEHERIKNLVAEGLSHRAIREKVGRSLGLECPEESGQGVLIRIS